MRPLIVRALLLLAMTGPVQAGQVDAHVSGEFKPGVQSGAIGSALGAPAPIQLTVPSLMTSGAITPGLTPELAPRVSITQPAAVRGAAAKPAVTVAVPVSHTLPPARTEASLKTRAPAAAFKPAEPADNEPAPGFSDGRERFDLASERPGGAPTRGSHGSWSHLKSPTLRTADADSARAAVPRPSLFKDAAELSVVSIAGHILAAILAVIAGSFAAYPILAGALWGFGAAQLINYLADLRSVVSGGWQASHDMRMRHDYSTGKLRDIRGRKYGEDRYDTRLNGPVSVRERSVIDAAAVLSGLPWVLGGGPVAVAAYLLSASSAVYLRRLWRRSRPQPKIATPPTQTS